MKIDRPDAYQTATELDIIQRTLPLRDANVLELGCGSAWMTRKIAEQFHPGQITAAEVDRIQHEKNLAITDLPGVRFIYGGAEAIDLPDASVDIVLMLKSLHHVPLDKMDPALKEIARVLRPGGLAYISEPVYRGDFNEILRLFHDEQAVRKAAFQALQTSVQEKRLQLVEQIFFNSPGHYKDFDDFEARMLNVTHTEHNIDEVLYGRIKAAFMQHMTDQGAHFMKPSRVDLLRKP
ncbi:MAG: SAM-dependent methyltransferase [Sedimenticola sp.]|jgi:ubiquinone/menaquinone biosynthesis C-methylase UbiE|nr:MAG: SAM-dependent methyltransferase [Sedimenticola sp.]